MRRSACLGILTLTGVLVTAATHEAQQERVDLEVQQITDNLYMLANASTVQGMGGGGNTAIFAMFQRKGLPFIDVVNGNGSATAFGATLGKAAAGIPDVDTVIPGHNPTPVTWAEFVDFSAFYNDVVSKAQNGKAAGRSVDDVVAAYRVPDEYSDFAAPERSVRTTMQYVYEGR